jgi:hypothetical protein
VGEYYVVGQAGEQGQPGQWLIRWEIQKTYSSPFQIVEQRYQVLDAAPVEGFQPPRVTKQGWG